MSTPWLRTALRVGMVLVLGASARLAAAAISAVARPTLWRVAEFRVSDGPTATNPFDPDEIRVDATFTGPGGAALTVPAFWFQDYRREQKDGKEILTPEGAPEWRVRFTPTQPGEHHLKLTETRGAAGEPKPLAELSFEVSARDVRSLHHWVTLGSDPQSLATSDGQALRLIGENVCWPQNRGTVDYDDWFLAMQRSGQNFARLWMAPWWAPLEHVPGTLTHYRLDAAWELDHVFQQAAERGIYLMFCFDHHGMYQVDNANWGGSNNFWKTNPYNAAQGGPCATPNDFFASPAARTLYQKRLRYLIARYGSSPDLLAWQFMNEIDNVYGALKAEDVTSWHADMGRWMRAHDPFKHLITTSLTGGSDRPEMWKLPEMDLTVYHSYGDVAPARRLTELGRAYAEHYGKPFLVGEFGTSSRNWNIASDPHLRGLRQGLWGGVLGGSIGTAMSWWWEDIHAANAYPAWEHLATIVHSTTWPEGRWTPVDFIPNGPPPAKVGQPDSDGVPFDAELTLAASWRARTSNVLAVSSPLAASRGAEYLAAFLRPTDQPYRLSAWLAAGAQLILHVDSVAADVELVVRVDGREIGRARLPDKDHRTIVNREYDTDYRFALPSGQHEIQVANLGQDWVNFSAVKVHGVRPSSLEGNWTYAPEPIGLRQGTTTIVYAVSPWTVYPAGATLAAPPMVTGKAITLLSAPAGEYRARWYDPLTGRFVGSTEATTRDGALQLPLPEFNVDVAGVVELASARPIRTPKAGKAPRINSAPVFGVRPGHPFLYHVPVSGERPIAYSAEGLPAGLSLDGTTGQITGVLVTPGEHLVRLRARNSQGSATKTLKIVAGETIALTPQMGWNSWNHYAAGVSADIVRTNARAMVESGLIDHGWTYINIDDGWQGARGGEFHGIQGNEKFPDMKALADYVHGLGLKIGLYSTPWVESYAGYIGGSAMNQEGTWTRTADRKQTNRKVLPWAIGTFSFAANDAKQWAAWGFDYLKYDWNPNELPETKEMGEALRRSGRDIVLSLSNATPFASVDELSPYANSWRIAGDIKANWSSMTREAIGDDKWRTHARPGHWNDPDMLEIGTKERNQPGLTPEEEYTHMTWWCLLSAPLLLGNDMSAMDDFTLNLLTNDEVIAVNQDELGEQAAPVIGEGEQRVYVKKLADGGLAVGLFNLGSAPATVLVKWSDLKLEGKRSVRDLWRQKDLGKFDDAFPMSVAPHSAELVKVE